MRKEREKKKQVSGVATAYTDSWFRKSEQKSFFQRSVILEYRTVICYYMTLCYVMILIILVQLIVLFVNVVLKENLLNIFYYVVSGFKMPEISWFTLLMTFTVVRKSTVGTNVCRYYKEWRQRYKGRFVSTRMLYCTKVFTLVLYFCVRLVFYHFEFLLRVGKWHKERSSS